MVSSSLEDNEYCSEAEGLDCTPPKIPFLVFYAALKPTMYFIAGIPWNFQFLKSGQALLVMETFTFIRETFVSLRPRNVFHDESTTTNFL